MTVIGLVIGGLGLLVGVAGLWFGYSQRQQGRAVSAQLDRLESALRERSPAIATSASEAMARSLREPHDATNSRDVADAVRRLPERQRLAVTLRFYEGLGRDEISEILGLSPTDVDSILADALERLRATVNPARFRRSADGDVELEGTVTADGRGRNVGSARTVVFQLPDSYQPPHDMPFEVESAGGRTEVLVKRNGEVLADLNERWVRFDGIRFKTG
jgi:hypothetical protein